MNPLPFLEGRQRVFIRQKKEWTEILIDWETRNQYEVLDSEGEELGTVSERARSQAVSRASILGRESNTEPDPHHEESPDTEKEM